MKKHSILFLSYEGEKTMKRVASFFLSIMLIINAVTMTVAASEAGSENKCLKEAEILVTDEDGKDYYRQFKGFDKPVFINLAEDYLDNKPQFYLTNAWSDLLNEEYRRKGTFKNEYIYDMIIMGFLKYEVASDSYSDSLFNRTKDFATDLYSVLDKELGTVFEKSKISDSTMEFYHNKQTISDLGLAMNVVDYAEESYEIYLNVMASKMALLESNRDKLSLFRESVNIASNNEDKDYVSAMNLIIDAMDTADPAEYLNKKTDVECSSFLLGAVEDVVKEINPIFQLLDLSVSGIDLVFNSSDNASNDIKLAYLYLADAYLRQGLNSIVEKYINLSDLSNKTSENARAFIDSFKTYLLFQKFGNLYAEEWLDNYIKVRSGPIKRLFHKKEIQQAKDMKEQCKSENESIEKMLKGINNLEKEEDTWKIIPKKNDSEEYTNAVYVDILQKYETEIRSWESKLNEYNSWFDDADASTSTLYDKKQVAITDINGDGVEELLFVADTDSKTNEGWEDYTEDLYVFTIQNGQAVKVYQNRIFTEAAGGHRYLIVTTTDDQLVILDTSVDAFEDCIMDQYSLQGSELRRENNYGLLYNPFAYEDEPMYSIKRDEEYVAVTEAEFESYSQSLSTGFEKVLIKSGGGIELSIYDIQNKQNALAMTYDEALQHLGINDTYSQDDDYQNSEDSSWKQAYVEYIKNDPNIAFNQDSCTCGLVFIDGDDIPELIIEYSNEADGTGILSIKNGGIVSYRFSRTGGIRYIEREGQIYNSIGHQGLMEDELALLDDSGFHDQGHGYRYDESQEYTNYTEFNWNGKDISENEYYANIDQFDVARAKEWNSYADTMKNNNYTPSEICSYLSDK